MKTSKLFASVLMAAGVLVSFSSMASAGEGGAAGSVSVIMSGGSVSSLSAAAAIGKLNAAAASNATSTDTFASAYGSAGVVDLDISSDTTTGTYTAKYVGADDADLGTAQANSFAAETTIDATTGTVTIIP
jgi:hypothetical protein